MKLLIHELVDIILKGEADELLNQLKQHSPTAYNEFVLAVLDRLPK